MTRWILGYRKNPAIRRFTLNIPFSGVTVSPESSNFEWPSSSEIFSSQQKHRDAATKDATTDDDGKLQVKGKTWMHNDCIELKLRLLKMSHEGDAGH